MTDLEQILVSGSDSRLAVDTLIGLNRFGCAPAPRPEALSFGSSTASSISPQAFAYVQSEYHRLRGEHSLDASMEEVRQELTDLLGLNETGTEIVFSPSGTDSTLHALFLVRALSGDAPLDCLLTASDETGSSVPMALSGRHFSDRTAEGVSVTPGDPISGLGDGRVTLIELPRRGANGELRPAECLDEEVWEAAERAAGAGHHLLVQVMDSSKMGASCPSPECRRRLSRRFAGSIHFVVDACQMRLSRTRLRDHLAAGYLVLISGSKFFTGPPFSGALLVPAYLAACLQEMPLTASGLRDYTTRCAWPQRWTALRASLPNRSCLGQYLRWSAALSEMRAYYAVPSAFRGQSLRQSAEMTTRLLQDHASGFLLLNQGGEPETEPRTIFPFLVQHGSGWLSYTQTVALYHSLNRNMVPELPGTLTAEENLLAAQICHIGQPVRIPLGGGKDAGALRLATDARMVSHLWGQHQAGHGATGLEQQICTVLAKTALMTRYMR